MSDYENYSSKRGSLRRLRLKEQTELHALLQRKLKSRVESSLAAYVREAWPVLEPARDYTHGWHIDAICEYLTAVRDGRIRRLIITLPPRHMKSLLASVFWPTWCWATHPESRWLFASYSSWLSIKHSLDRRAVIQSEWYQNFWRDRFRLREDQNEKSEFTNSRQGTMIATSVGGSATGRGGDFILVDDLHNPLQAESDTQREEALRFFDQTLTTRLDDPQKGAIVVIMHRLHERDLVGHLMEHGGWELLRLPAQAENCERIVLPMSGRVLERNPDDLLWPARFPLHVLEEQRGALGSYAYAGQYQQRPAPAEGGVIERSWWRRYEQCPIKFDEVIESWDCSFKATSGSDFVVGQVWGRIRANIYLLDQVRQRLSFSDTKRAVERLSRKWPEASAKLIEDAANGPAIIDSLRSAVSGLIPINPKGGKPARVHAISPIIESGNVYLPSRTLAPWIDEFVEECAAFPNGAHDDQLDAASQAIQYFHKRRQPYAGVISRGLFGPSRGVLSSEELFEKAMRGEPLTSEEIDRLP